MLAAVLPAMLWPGDNPWTNDEPRLLANAWHASAAGHPAWGGLWGNFGIRYGPLPTQLYQLLLGITHDPLILAALRGVLCAALTGGSLLWLARSAGFSPWFAVAVVAAPRVLINHRTLWDASFAMPLGALALAALAALVRGGAARNLILSFTASAFLATVHPQALPLAAAIGGFIVWRRRPALRANWRALLVVLAFFLALNGAYFFQLTQLIAGRFLGAVSAGYPGGAPPHIAALAPFLGGNLLAAPPDAAAQTFIVWMQRLTLLVYPLCWAGLALAARRAWKLVRNHPATARENETVIAKENNVRDAVAAVALAAVVMQGLLFAVMRVPSGDQYFFGTFAAHVCLAWLGVDALAACSLRNAAIAAWGIAGASLSFHAMLLAHERGLPGDPAPPSLAVQQEVARSLGEYSAPVVFTDAPYLRRFPQGIRALRLLLPIASGKSGARLLITPRIESDGKGGRLEVRELADAEILPPSATPLDITPLPEGWFPPPAP